VLILSKSPLLGRSMARVVGCAGATAQVITELGELERTIKKDQVRLVCLPVSMLEESLALTRGSKGVQFMVCVEGPTEEVLPVICEAPQVSHVFGLRYPEAPPRVWELLAVVRRWADGEVPPFGGYLGWGGLTLERQPATTEDRDAVVNEVEQLCRTLLGEREAGAMAEVAHELLMNAMYDAPVGPNGRPLYAHDRRASISLAPAQRPRFFCGCDGSKLVLSAVDPFGRLRREHVFGGLTRALATGSMDRSGGGAGLGFMVMYRACTMLFFDVQPGVSTQATTVLELDVPSRELRRLPRSIHFFHREL